ncbi:MAG TPA: NADH-quinone oxidoreductase subunit J [Candidatus Krumholzibacteriaceae bacterium]|nr:NADH-quinone oxidoreductase subunit J [Candidatus Krumholzibacteriaceae bacterium]
MRKGPQTLTDLAQIALMSLAAILALATVELRDILHAIIAFCGMCITIGALFWLLDAPYVAVFQLLIYAGAIVALFTATVMLTTRKESIR